jgi:hypothetical protein
MKCGYEIGNSGTIAASLLYYHFYSFYCPHNGYQIGIRANSSRIGLESHCMRRIGGCSLLVHCCSHHVVFHSSIGERAFRSYYGVGEKRMILRCWLAGNLIPSGSTRCGYGAWSDGCRVGEERAGLLIDRPNFFESLLPIHTVPLFLHAAHWTPTV